MNSEQLHAARAKLPAAVFRLGNAVWNDTAETFGHEACRAALPALVDAELAGEAIAKLFPNVKHHLDRCDGCAFEYAELLDVALAAQRGALPQPDPNASPDLSFLPAQAAAPSAASSLPDRVLAWTHSLLPNLTPDVSRVLDTYAHAFFDRLAKSATLQLEPRVLREQAVGYDNFAGTWLFATYAATQDVVQHVSRAEWQSWHASAALQRRVESRARTAAEQAGISPDTAARFAQAYAAYHAARPTEMQALLSSS